MSFWTKLRDKVVKPVGKVVNGVGKVVSASGIPVISSVGAVLDACIPDNKLEKMSEKVSEQGVIKVDKVEETILNNAPEYASNNDIKLATKATTEVLAQMNPSAKFDDTLASTKLTIFDKYKLLWQQKNILFIGAHIVLLFIGYCYLGKGKKRKIKKRW